MRYLTVCVACLALAFLISACPGPKPQPEPVPVPIDSGPFLQVCADGTRLCDPQSGSSVWVRGYSGYGAFSLFSSAPSSAYPAFLESLAGAKVNLMREWAVPYPQTWDGIQPYVFSGGRAQLNESFWQNADAFLALAAKHRISVLVDLVDHYGAAPDQFASNPLNRVHGGPLTRGLPDLYASPEVLEMIELGVRRLSKWNNIIYQVANEPGGYASVAQVTEFHRAVVNIIRAAYRTPEGAPRPVLIAINPVPDSRGRPGIPLPSSVGADLVTLHGAAVEEPSKRSSCTPGTLSARLDFLQRLLRVPVVVDTDGIHSRKNPCNRYDETVIADILSASSRTAGVNLRGGEPMGEEAPSESVIRLLGAFQP